MKITPSQLMNSCAYEGIQIERALDKLEQQVSYTRGMGPEDFANIFDRLTARLEQLNAINDLCARLVKYRQIHKL